MSEYGEVQRALLRKRYAAERRFRRMGAAAVLAALTALVLLLGSVLWQGLPAFFEHRVRLDVALDADAIDPAGTRDPLALGEANYAGLLRSALGAHLPEVSGRSEKRALAALLSPGAAYDLQERVLADHQASCHVSERLRHLKQYARMSALSSPVGFPEERGSLSSGVKGVPAQKPMM